MKIKDLFLLTFLACACSPHLLEPSTHSGKADQVKSLRTKASGPQKDVSPEVMMHSIQSDHMVMLVNHIAKKDNRYYLSLTKEDIAQLGITDKELDLVNAHINLMNEKNEKN